MDLGVFVSHYIISTDFEEIHPKTDESGNIISYVNWQEGSNLSKAGKQLWSLLFQDIVKPIF